MFQNTFLQVHLKRGLYEDGRPGPPLALLDRHPPGRRRAAEGGPAPDGQPRPAASSSGETERGAPGRPPGRRRDGPAGRAQGEERREWVRESVARLPEALRQTLILAYHQDLKYREIADILKIPVGTVKSRLHAALAKLQQMARAANRDGNG